jgi:hypothetical protein
MEVQQRAIVIGGRRKVREAVARDAEARDGSVQTVGINWLRI